MKIAIPYESGMVFQHFGHTAEFKFYEVENGQVTASEVVSTNGQGHGALVGFLARRDQRPGRRGSCRLSGRKAPL